MQHAVRSRSSISERLAAQVATRGFAICPNFLSQSVCEQLRLEARELFADGTFHQAHVGLGERKKRVASVRSDHIQWLEHDILSVAQRRAMHELEQVRIAINRTSYLGLFDWEGHLACYPPGGRYERHLDVFPEQPTRKLSTVLYLNPAWEPSHGGALRIHLDDESEACIDVAPRAGTLVVFLSEVFEHEVLEAVVERWSLTGWYRVRPMSDRRVVRGRFSVV